MKATIIFMSCILLLLLVFEKSGAFVTVSYQAIEGGIKVDKTRWEWHPERIFPYLHTFFQKKSGPLSKKQALPSKKIRNKGAKQEKPPYRLSLKNGAVLKGNVLREDEEGVLFQLEDGEIYFQRTEISSLEKE